MDAPVVEYWEVGKGKAAREKGIVHGTDTMCMPLVGLRDMAGLL